MDFPHQGRILTAVHPFYQGNSKTLQERIRKDGFKEPTSAELTSFVHEYFDGTEPQAQEVNKIMKEGYFRGFTGILYVPDKKVAHFIDYPEFDKGSFVDSSDLLKRLDESYDQVDFSHLKEGAVSWNEVANHPYFIAWAKGKEGSEKLAELASKHPRKEAYIRVPNVLKLTKPTARVADLNSYWDGGRLGVESGYHGGDEYGSSFGVLK